MLKNQSQVKFLWLLALSSSLLAFPSCSPKIKMGIWAKRHNEAATALGNWAANNPLDAAALLTLDCLNEKQFKKKISDAFTGSAEQQPAQQNSYDARQPRGNRGSNSTSGSSGDGFADWCRKYPKAAKTLRSHAKALCKTGLGILDGRYKIE